MIKIFAEAVAGVYPTKLGRNRWRGILRRYGAIRALKLLIKLRRGKDTPAQHYLTICAIAKNEGPYFREWIEWHHNLGVEKFYIYDNESTDNTKEVLAPFIESGLVEYTRRKGKRQQAAAYADCLDRHRFDSRWIAVIDLDEFIVPVKHSTIPEFLRGFEQFPAVEINWLIYGSGGAKEKTEGKVMDRFRKHSVPGHYLNRHVKSIVDPRRVFTLTGVHEAARISGYAADSHGNPVKKVFMYREPQQDVIRINHYTLKSYEEFLAKRARGRARVAGLRDLDYFHKFDLNDVEE